MIFWVRKLSYLISTQCWPLANQNKSFLSLQTWRLTFSVKHFTLLLNQIFFFIRDIFWECIFSKEHPIGFRGSVIIEKQYSYHLNCQKYSFTGTQEPFKWWRTLRDTFSWKLKKKYLGLVSFWAPLKGCSWIFKKQGHCFYESSLFFSISHFSSLETECTKAAVCSCFSK